MAKAGRTETIGRTTKAGKPRDFAGSRIEGEKASTEGDKEKRA